MTLASFDSTLKDLYPLPGQRLKQWVVDDRRETAWANETAPRVYLRGHDDNTLLPCRNAGDVRYHDLDHDACDVCGALHEAFAREPRVKAWIEAKAARPPVCADRSKLSDEVEPADTRMSFGGALLAMLPRKDKP